MGVGIALLAVISLGGYWFVRNEAANQFDSIVVLPFENVSGDLDAEYLSDGISESLINSLTELEDLKVIARTTAFRYKGKAVDPQVVGRELNVRAVLTGRVRQDGDKLDIQIDLIDAATGTQVWGAGYERKISDVLYVKQTIVLDVVEKLRSKISGEQQQQLVKGDTTNAEAFQFYLKARLYRNIGNPEAMKKAREQYQQAINLDPNYALAHVGMADCYLWLQAYSVIPYSEGISKSRAAVDRALHLDDSSTEAHTTLSHIFDMQWLWTESREEIERAIKCNPNYPRAHQLLSNYLLYDRQFDEALREAKRAQELDPLSPSVTYMVALVHLLRNDLDLAIEESRKAIEVEPRNPASYNLLGWVYLKQKRNDEATAEFLKGVELSERRGADLRDLGYCYAITGKRAESHRILQELKEKYAKGEASGQQIAGVYTGLGDKDSAFGWLEKDFQQHGVGLANITYWPSSDLLRSDPRYVDLLRRMNMPLLHL